MRARRPPAARRPPGWRRYPPPRLRELKVLGAEVKRNLFALEDVGDGRRGVRILPRNQARRCFDDADLAAEAAEGLRKLKTDVAAADDDQMLRHDARSRAGCVLVTIGDLVEARDLRNKGATTDVEENLWPHSAFRRPPERCRARQSARAPGRPRCWVAPEPALHATPRKAEDIVLARLHLFHVDADVTADGNAVVAGRDGRAGRHRRSPPASWSGYSRY